MTDQTEANVTDDQQQQQQSDDQQQQTDDQQKVTLTPPDKDQQTDDQQTDDQQKQAEGYPEDGYKDFEMPEGFEPDEAIMKPFKEIAQELNLGQDQAQKLVGMFNEWRQANDTSAEERWGEIQEGWRKEAAEDKEFGGDKFQENLAFGKKAIEVFGSPKLVEALNLTGMGDHPEVLRFAIAVGRAISDDQSHRQTGNPPPKEGQKDAAALLFPSVAQD